MKQHKTKGEMLHEELEECLTPNPMGLPYMQCSRECQEEQYWVIDKEGNNCFSSIKQKKEQPFHVKSISSNSKVKKSWLVCVDEGLVTNQKSNATPRCDNLLFNDEIFYYVEAKMRVKGDNWKAEIDDAVKNKIPTTKQFIDNSLRLKGYEVKQQIGIAIPFPALNYKVPRDNPQKEESLRQKARKHAGNWVSKLTLRETIEL